MFKPLLLFFAGCLALSSYAQTNNKIYGVVIRNFYRTVASPFNPNVTTQRLDSSVIRIGSTDGSSGVVTNIGNNTYNKLVSITGAALDPYRNKFVFTGPEGVLTFDLTSGNLINSLQFQNMAADRYFDNFRMNHADSSIYGLIRGSYIDSTTPGPDGEVFLGKLNSETGAITKISPASVAKYFTLAGSAIDPYQMVFYFMSLDSLVGLDIYDGTVRSKATVQLPANSYFDNFTYSCADTSIYGLVRQSFYTTVYSPIGPRDSVQRLDSTSVKLAKINPATGQIIYISPVSLSEKMYTLNGSSAIDPGTMTYYYSTPTNLVGVSLSTGLITSNVPISLTDGNSFNLMRSFENCRNAELLRRNPVLPPLPTSNAAISVRVYPNPAASSVTIKSKQPIRHVCFIDLNGRVVFQQTLSVRQTTIDISRLVQGMYLLQVQGSDGQVATRRFMKN